ncbi:MAG: hypothetical protein E7001_05755 [Coriobacteriaceae bacterium]|nr:hypothetical protein [Coriobacteriaceae bacterium]
MGADAGEGLGTATAGPRPVVTTCGGCYADCAFAATLEEGEGGGRVQAELPVVGHPCAARALCHRGRMRLGMPFLPDEERVLRPLRRRADGSGFDEVSWEEAYAGIAGRLGGVLDASGPGSVAMTVGVPSSARIWAGRFMAALGSPNVYGADGACEVSRLTGWEHTLGYSPVSDLVNTNCIMYLGRSIVDSATMAAVDALNAARRRGAKIIVVDPRRSPSAVMASRWLRVRPGCDLALLLGIIHVLIEEDLYDRAFVAAHATGFDELAAAARAWTPAWAEERSDVPAQEIVATARDLAAAAPAAVVDAGFHGGIGVAYANSTQTARAIAVVDALLGCIGQEGGCLNPPVPLALGRLDPERFPAPPAPKLPKLGADRYPLVDPVRGLCTTIGQSIDEGSLKALFVYASNPGAGYGNAGAWLGLLANLDLLVTIDIRLSETALASDFILPDVTYLEADRGVGTVVGSQDPRVFYRGRALEVRHPDTRPATRIFAELGRACGVGEYFTFTEDDLARAQIAPWGIDLDELRERGWADTGEKLLPRTGEPAITVPGGKIELASALWEDAGLGRTVGWIPPLVEPEPGCFRIIAGNRPYDTHSSSRALAADAARELGDDVGSVDMNEKAAAALGIEDGEVVELVSDLGRDRVRVRTTPYLHPSCIFTSAAPGARSGRFAGLAEAGREAGLGVGPLDHTPLRWDPLTGAALTQENVVRVRRIEG